MFESLNESINASFIGRYFEMKERGTNFTTELAGATATFLTLGKNLISRFILFFIQFQLTRSTYCVAYILAINPRILAESGGTCEGFIFSPEYEECLEDIKKEYITATAISSMFGCFLMGLVANLPIALA